MPPKRAATADDTRRERWIEYLPLGTLAPAPRNPKRHDLVTLRASIERFGYVEPVVRDERTGRLVAGHGRTETLAEAKAAGLDPPDGLRVDPATGDWLYPVVRGWASKNDAEAEAYVLASNQTTIAAGWDPVELRAVVADLSDYAGSMCEHHLAPALGVAHFGYVPDRLITGYSKVKKALNYLSRQPQLNERLLVDALDAIEATLQPKGCGLVLDSIHMCLVCKSNAPSQEIVVVQGLRGVMKSDPYRRDFLQGVRMNAPRFGA